MSGDLVARLRLVRSPGIGPVTFRQLRKLASPNYPFDHQAEAMPIDPPTELRARIIELLGPSPAPVDEIVRLSGAAPGEVQLVLLELDLAGRLERHAGGKVSLPA